MKNTKVFRYIKKTIDAVSKTNQVVINVLAIWMFLEIIPVFLRGNIIYRIGK